MKPPCKNHHDLHLSSFPVPIIKYPQRKLKFKADGGMHTWFAEKAEGEKAHLVVSASFRHRTLDRNLIMVPLHSLFIISRSGLLCIHVISYACDFDAETLFRYPINVEDILPNFPAEQRLFIVNGDLPRRPPNNAVRF